MSSVVRVIVGDDAVHCQEYHEGTRLLVGDFACKPDGFECYYDMVRNGQPIAVEIPWKDFNGILKLYAERVLRGG